jgi:hypothetical protein
MTRTLLILLTSAAVACTPAANVRSPNTSTAVADTLVGFVSEVGADPATFLTLRPTGTRQSIRLSGDGTALLRVVAGAEVWVSGARQTDDFRVDVFEVRKVNGIAVDDGTVAVDQGKAFVVNRSGSRREIPNAPPQLVASAGSRIWVSRPVVGQAPSWGLIKQR